MYILSFVHMNGSNRKKRKLNNMGLIIVDIFQPMKFCKHKMFAEFFKGGIVSMEI